MIINMQRIILTIFAMVLSVVYGEEATAKENQQYPQVTIALRDSTVFKGYLRCDLHGVDKKLSVSEIADGKKISYKIEDINSVKVIYADGDSITFHPIYVWDGMRRKVSKTPVLSNACYSSDNITCYKIPGMYVRSTAAVPSNYFQSQTTSNRAWIYYKKIKSESEYIKLLYTYIPSKKTPKLKSILSDIKNNFKKEDFQYIKETVESQEITAEQIIDKPWILLEILDDRDKHAEPQTLE